MKMCPVTGVEMKHEVRHSVEIDVSPCGMWLDKGELLTLTEMIRRDGAEWTYTDLFTFLRKEQRPPVDHDRVLDCPVTGKPMKVETYMGVHIDWSPDVGVWLDNGELEAIINNLKLDPQWLGKVSLKLWEHRY